MPKKMVLEVPDDLDIATLGGNFALVVKKGEKGYAIDKTVSEKNIARLTLKPVDEAKPVPPNERKPEVEIMEGFKTYAKTHETPAEKPA